ncbi:hypothetical protein PanWU01x14_204010 [Parasponia andersonii]|uniref:Uncharacterized protein n=1 Tax=Parasponia andersonii TaxID=3476 RepID=A0A2P5BWK8_PARAD|nr:hypothetical protein PanWU01x14_204010 [Parasponia andersonii]
MLSLRAFSIIQPGASVHVYYGDLVIEYNYRHQLYVHAFLEGQEHRGQPVLTSEVRSSEVIEFGFENGEVTYKTIEGKYLARIGSNYGGIT